MEERIEKLKSFLVQNPNDSFLKHALALEFIKLGEDKRARELFNEILESEPAYTGSYYHLGKLLERIGDPVSARIIYEKGLTESRKAGDEPTYRELQTALEDLD